MIMDGWADVISVAVAVDGVFNFLDTLFATTGTTFVAKPRPSAMF